MIVIASDHGGYALKQELMAHLKEKGVEFEDIGTYSEASCNYPEYAERAARGVAEGKYEKGILVCGTGIGMSLAANNPRHPLRAAVRLLQRGDVPRAQQREHVRARRACHRPRACQAHGRSLPHDGVPRRAPC